MFMQIATSVIGVAVVLFVGYVVISSVRGSLNASAAANTGMDNAQTTVFAAFALIAVGVIVLAAFGIVAIFQ